MTPFRFASLVVSVGLLLSAGCKPKAKEITSLARKEAATLASEAQFAVQVKDFTRAESLMAKAAELCPDSGKYWVDLGSARARLGKKDQAKTAYQSGLKAYQDAAKADSADAAPVMQQIYVLALLGKPDEARSVLDKAAKQFPQNPNVRTYVEKKLIDQMLADPRFKEIAL